MATNTNPTVLSILAGHGYASIDDARADNVSFGCFGCGSIKSVTANSEAERIIQRDLLHENFVLACCEEDDEFLL